MWLPPQWGCVILAILALPIPVSARVAPDVRRDDRGSRRSQCARDPLYCSFTEPRSSAAASSFCSTFIRSTVRAEATRTQTHTAYHTARTRVTTTATVTKTSVVGVVHTDDTTSTKTITVDVTATSVSTTDVPSTVATDVITTTVATETDDTTVATTPTTITATTATVTVVGRGDPHPDPGHWTREYGPAELSCACSCLLTKAPPARTIYTGTATDVTTDAVVTDITSTETVTKTVHISRTTTTTTKTEVVATRRTHQTTTVTTVQATTTVEESATETTTLDATRTTTEDITAATTTIATASATVTLGCESEPPFLLQASGSPADGQYLYFTYDPDVSDNVLQFGSSSTASTFTLNSQCNLVTNGYISQIGDNDFYDIIREETSSNYPLVCSIANGGLSCTDNAGGGLNSEFSYNALNCLAFESSGGGGSNTLTLNVIPA